MDFDLAVIGGGPGGYVGAIRAGQLGMKVACIERTPSYGGTCLNIGCIPSKALLDSTEFLAEIQHNASAHGITVGEVQVDLGRMMERKDKIVSTLTRGIPQLFAKNKVTSIAGEARFASPTELIVTTPDGEERRVTASKMLVATGSVPIPFPGVPFDEDRILSSTGALALEQVPESLIVIGGGVIGMELGSVWLRLGSKVTVLELAPTILPGMDEDMVKAADKLFRKQGFDIRTGVRVTGLAAGADSVTVSLEDGTELVAERVLVAMGRRPSSRELAPESVGIQVSDRGAIVVNERYHTGVAEIYAVGDAIGGLLLAHKAEEEGIAAVENMAGLHGHVEYPAIPAVVYTSPELASVGMTETEARASGAIVGLGKFPFSINARAKALNQTDGWVKVLADKRTGRLLGVHIIGSRASDLIAEAALAMEYRGSAEDLGTSVHAHPTLPEALKEAALGALGRAIHN